MLCCTRLILFDPVLFADSATTIYSLDLLGGRNYSASAGSPFNTDPVHVRARSRQHFRFTKPGPLIVPTCECWTLAFQARLTSCANPSVSNRRFLLSRSFPRSILSLILSDTTRFCFVSASPLFLKLNRWFIVANSALVSLPNHGFTRELQNHEWTPTDLMLQFHLKGPNSTLFLRNQGYGYLLILVAGFPKGFNGVREAVLQLGFEENNDTTSIRKLLGVSGSAKTYWTYFTGACFF